MRSPDASSGFPAADALGAAPDADLVVETDPETFFLLCAGQLEPKAAVKSGRARIEGDRALFERCFRVLTFAPRVSAEAGTVTVTS